MVTAPTLCVSGTGSKTGLKTLFPSLCIEWLRTQVSRQCDVIGCDTCVGQGSSEHRLRQLVFQQGCQLSHSPALLRLTTLQLWESFPRSLELPLACTSCCPIDLREDVPLVTGKPTMEGGMDSFFSLVKPTCIQTLCQFALLPQWQVDLTKSNINLTL